jgi:DNA-binding response OmpR family regulator
MEEQGSLTLPAVAPDPAVQPAAEEQMAEDAITILLVEDDKVLQELYYERFMQAGFKVIQAFDGLQALDKMESYPEIKLVLLDLMLPRLSGYDVLAHIKQDADTRNIPVIIVSALADVDDQARGLQLGAAEYITKGEMLPAAVIEKIKQYVLSVPRPKPGDI